MPNPWAPPQQQQTETTTPAPVATPGEGGTPTTTTPSSGGGTTATSLLGGIPFNPDTMSSAFQAPYVRQMLDVMASNPETFEAFLSANPVWSAASQDPAMRENLRRMLPQLARQMSRPGFVEMLSNPRAMRVSFLIGCLWNFGSRVLASWEFSTKDDFMSYATKFNVLQFCKPARLTSIEWINSAQILVHLNLKFKLTKQTALLRVIEIYPLF